MKIKTKDDLLAAICATFTESEIMNINPRVYSNPDHVDYWIAYHCEEYHKCCKYLLKNRTVLK